MRRHAMGLALAGLMLAGCGSDNGGDPIVVETFRNPPELKSANGELRTVFTVGTSTFQVDGRTVTSSVYNNAYIPQVLRLRPGDTLFLDLDNRITEQTNLHYHGLNVSPRINADAHRFGQHLRDRRSRRAAQLPRRDSRQPQPRPLLVPHAPARAGRAAGDGRPVGRTDHRGRARPVPAARRASPSA